MHEGSVLLTAISWIAGVILGPVATGIAIASVAFFGFAMLQGYFDWQRGLRIVIGLFLVFGASSIAHSIAGMRGSSFASNDVMPPEPINHPEIGEAPVTICWNCDPLQK